MWVIRQDAMLFRDEHALKIMRENVDPQTQRVALKQGEMSKLLRCTEDTMTDITQRLEAAGYIRKHRTGKRGPCQIEVLAVSEEA